MENAKQLASRFREVILNGTWVANTNFKQQLDGLSLTTATTSYHGLNSMAVLAQHIHYYIKGITQVFEGGNLEIKDKYSFDFAPLHSTSEWENFLTVFWNDAAAFADWVEQMTPEKLNAVFAEEKYGTYQRNIEGMIEHSYYHLGQIVLLKKLLEK